MIVEAPRSERRHHALRHGAHHGPEIDARMLEEVGVFGGDEGVDDVARDAIDGDDGAALFKQLADELTVAGQDAGDHFGVVLADLVDGR